LPAEENPVPALNEIRAEKAIENAMLGNEASSLQPFRRFGKTRFTGNELKCSDLSFQ
jgi:hypothetical protein